MPKLGELTPGQKAAAGAGGTAALALAAALAIVPVWEGKSNRPYRDVVGVPTVCYGETNVPMRTYSDAECRVMLRASLQPYMSGVLRVNPRISQDPYQWAAHASLAYNIGVVSYSRSSVARLYAAGREREACDAIGAFRFAGGRPYRGLVVRRQGDATRLGEIELCKTGMPVRAA